MYRKSIVWSAVVVILCLIPTYNMPYPGILHIPHFNKFVHLCFYCILAVLLKSDGEKAGISQRKTDAATLLTVIVMGGVIEILQANYFNRSGDWYDMLANVLGGLTGLTVYRFLPAKWKRLL